MSLSPNTCMAAAEAIRRGHKAGGPGHDATDACLTLADRLDAEGQLQADPLSALDMAVNLASRVQQYAEALNDPDPDRRLQAQIAQAGERAHTGAQLAANLAMVSMAQDLHQITGAIRTVQQIVAQDRQEEGWSLRGAVDDARRTRDHMRAWAAGEQTHPGEDQPGGQM